jgi:plastocyanin
MLKLIGIGAVALTAAAAAAPCAAADLQIFQKGKEFSEKSVTIRAGQSIEFVNDDGNVHNVHSATEGHVFDLGAQEPGASNTHVFAAPGEVAVRCAIHPRMRLAVTVE